MKRGVGMVKSSKKSQYYLIAAVIIITVILGASVVANYVITRDEPTKFYDLEEELHEETSRVVDYGIYNEMEIIPLIEDFTSEYFVEYAEDKDKDTEFVFIYGSKKNVKIATYFDDVLRIGYPDFGYDFNLFEDEDSDVYCFNDVIDDNIELTSWKILLQGCTLNSNLVLTDGMLRINGSTINGNIELHNSELKLTNSYVSENTLIDIDKKSSDMNLLIAGNVVDGNVDVDGGTLVIVNNTIGGHLDVSDETIVIQASDNTVYGYTEFSDTVEAENVEVNILGKVYTFHLEEGENFMFIITKEHEGETYVAV